MFSFRLDKTCQRNHTWSPGRVDHHVPWCFVGNWKDFCRIPEWPSEDQSSSYPAGNHWNLSWKWMLLKKTLDDGFLCSSGKFYHAGRSWRLLYNVSKIQPPRSVCQINSWYESVSLWCIHLTLVPGVEGSNPSLALTFFGNICFKKLIQHLPISIQV